MRSVMAKAKAKRAKGRRAAGPTRGASPAKSRKSKKSPKTRAKTARKARRRPALKAVSRRRVARSSASTRVKAKHPRHAARPAAKAARMVKKKVARPARKTVKAVTKKAVARATATRERRAPAGPVATPPSIRASRKAPPPVHGKLPALVRERRRLPEADVVPSPPSSLDLNRTPSAARSGQAEIAEHLADHTETGPELTGGDVDASWESAYSTGDEAPGGDNPTPDQDVVDEIGRSLGLVYEDTEELKGADKITERDKHRWELDPASAEDFEER
jgi:hypothetical protein